MSEEVVGTIENVDRLFSEIIVNGESHVSQRYVAPSTAHSSHSTRQAQVQGEDVHAVELNEVLHNFSDPDIALDVEALQQGLAGEISARTTADQTLDLAIAQETNARSSADNILQGNINTVSGNVSTLQGKVSTIESEIPSQASAQNKLADKNFVNSSISTNTANFLGTYTSLADIEAIQNPTNNDYAFLQTTDSAGNNLFDRYKYNADQSEWLFEYELNNSSFTAEQWATINSGLTQSSVTQDIEDAINALDVAQVGGAGKYISAISEADGKISVTETTMDTAPTANSTNAVTSGGVKTAIDNEATARDTAITNAINALDVASVGGSGKYISAISEADGKISATETTMDTAPTANSTNAVTSGGVKTAIDNAINALDAQQIGTGYEYCYLTGISETNGVISGTYEKFDQTPTAHSRRGVESGGVKDYVDNQIATAITQVLNTSF